MIALSFRSKEFVMFVGDDYLTVDIDRLHVARLIKYKAHHRPSKRRQKRHSGRARAGVSKRSIKKAAPFAFQWGPGRLCERLAPYEHQIEEGLHDYLSGED